MLIDSNCTGPAALRGIALCTSSNSAPCIGQVALQPVKKNCIAVTLPRTSAGERGASIVDGEHRDRRQRQRRLEQAESCRAPRRRRPPTASGRPRRPRSVAGVRARRERASASDPGEVGPQRAALPVVEVVSRHGARDEDVGRVDAGAQQLAEGPPRRTATPVRRGAGFDRVSNLPFERRAERRGVASWLIGTRLRVAVGIGRRGAGCRLRRCRAGLSPLPAAPWRDTGEVPRSSARRPTALERAVASWQLMQRLAEPGSGLLWPTIVPAIGSRPSKSRAPGESPAACAGDRQATISAVATAGHQVVDIS